MHTSYGNVYNRLKIVWEEEINLDPNRDLNLTDEQREDMEDLAKEALIKRLDSLLPDEVGVLGDGEIVGPATIPVDWDRIREQFAEDPSWYEGILATYFEVSAENDMNI